MVVGWVLHDMVVFLVSGEPALAGVLVTHSLLAALAAAVIATATARPRWLLPAVFIGLLVAWMVAETSGWTVSRIRLLQTSILLAGAVPALGWIRRRFQVEPLHLGLSRPGLSRPGLSRPGLSRPGLSRPGLATGGLLSVALASTYVDLPTESWLFAAAAAMTLASCAVRRASIRWAVTLLAVLVIGIPTWRQAREDDSVGRASLPPSPVAVDTARPNLLLVVLDTVRADRLALYGYGRQTTPFLDAFVRRHAVRYTGARSTSSWTLPSHASLFTGLLPSDHGATHPRGGEDASTVNTAAMPAQRLRADVRTLADALRDAGYRTGAVMANSTFLDPRFGLHRGFEHYDARPAGVVGGYVPLAQMTGLPMRAGHLPYREAEKITNLVLRWLADGRGDRPYFLTVNYMDAHSPYAPPPPFDVAFGGKRVADPVRRHYKFRSLLYDRSLLYLDSQLARLLSAIELEHTLVIVTSDHGESLGDHGYWMHDWTLYEEVVKVPLYVKPVGARGSEVIDQPVTGAEVFRIALRGLGLPVEAASADPPLFGEWFQHLRTPETGVLADKHVERDLIGWVDGSLKIIVSSTGEVEVYNLAHDPGELSPLTVSDEQAEAAREKAARWWADHPPLSSGPLEGGDLNEKELERLRGLGYIGGP